MTARCVSSCPSEQSLDIFAQSVDEARAHDRVGLAVLDTQQTLASRPAEEMLKEWRIVEVIVFVVDDDKGAVHKHSFADRPGRNKGST
jgi:hypothetical protein